MCVVDSHILHITNQRTEIESIKVLNEMNYICTNGIPMLLTLWQDETKPNHVAGMYVIRLLFSFSGNWVGLFRVDFGLVGLMALA